MSLQRKEKETESEEEEVKLECLFPLKVWRKQEKKRNNQKRCVSQSVGILGRDLGKGLCGG